MGNLWAGIVLAIFSIYWYKINKIWKKDKIKSAGGLDGYDKGVVVPRDYIILFLAIIGSVVCFLNFLLLD